MVGDNFGKFGKMILIRQKKQFDATICQYIILQIPSQVKSKFCIMWYTAKTIVT